MTCRTCALLDVRPDASGRIVPRKDKSYRCLAKIPIVPLPRSVRGYYFSHGRPVPGHMEPDEGDNCFYHEERRK